MGSSLSFSIQNYSMFYCLIKKHKFLLLSWFCLHNFLVLDNFNGFYTSQIKLNFCWRDKLKFVYLFFFFKVLLDRSPSTANHVPAHVRKSEGIESFFSCPFKMEQRFSYSPSYTLICFTSRWTSECLLKLI